MKAASVGEANMEQQSIDINSRDETTGANGWPLGLPPLNARISDSAAATVSHLTPPPSSYAPTSPSSSSSSSNFDSGSTRSFFPEKSMSLGSLIGIQSSSELLLLQNDDVEGDVRETNRRRLLRSLLSCGSHSRDSEVSTSLSHYLGNGSRVTTPTAPNNIKNAREQRNIPGVRQDCIHLDSNRKQSRPRATLQLILQGSSPGSFRSNSNHLSARRRIRTDQHQMESRPRNFWNGFCCKLSSSICNLRDV